MRRILALAGAIALLGAAASGAHATAWEKATEWRRALAHSASFETPDIAAARPAQVVQTAQASGALAARTQRSIERSEARSVPPPAALIGLALLGIIAIGRQKRRG